jgi:hypothetical protein
MSKCPSYEDSELEEMSDEVLAENIDCVKQSLSRIVARHEENRLDMQQLTGEFERRRLERLRGNLFGGKCCGNCTYWKGKAVTEYEACGFPFPNSIVASRDMPAESGTDCPQFVQKAPAT